MKVTNNTANNYNNGTSNKKEYEKKQDFKNIIDQEKNENKNNLKKLSIFEYSKSEIKKEIDSLKDVSIEKKQYYYSVLEDKHISSSEMANLDFNDIKALDVFFKNTLLPSCDEGVEAKIRSCNIFDDQKLNSSLYNTVSKMDPNLRFDFVFEINAAKDEYESGKKPNRFLVQLEDENIKVNNSKVRFEEYFGTFLKDTIEKLGKPTTTLSGETIINEKNQYYKEKLQELYSNYNALRNDILYV